MNRSTFPTLAMVLVLVVALGASGCKSLTNTLGALTDIKNLEFKLGDANAFKVSGIDISTMSQPSQISPLDMARVVANVAGKTLPVSFTLNVLARNPNTGSGRTQPTPLYLSKLDWTLIVDDRTTINGVVNRELEIPASGGTTTIPLQINMDLYKFFNDKGHMDLLNLAMAIGGANGSSSNLKLLAKVAVRIPGVGVVEYPDQITIVDQTFNSSR
jgi:hypothetical protein